MKESKKSYIKMILLALTAIALGIALLGGATYSFFSSQSHSNFVITSGKVHIIAEGTLSKASSAKWEDGDYTYPGLSVTENKATFTNGGTVFYDGDTLILERITPGDGATLKVDITNNSNVKIKYQVKVVPVFGGALYKALDIKLNTDSLKKKNTTEEDGWFTADIPEGDSESLGYALVDIKFPMDMDKVNDYQGASCSIAVTVTAVQSNAHVEATDESGDVTLDADLMANVEETISSTSDLEKTPAIIFGTWDQYESTVALGGYTSYLEGIEIPGEPGARMFYVDSNKDENMDLHAIYILAGMNIVAEEKGNETFQFAGKGFTYVDLSGVDFSATKMVGNMFHGSEVETLIMRGVDLSGATDLDNMFDSCSNLQNVDFSGANLASADDSQGISRLAVGDKAGLTNLKTFFKDCKNLEEINFSGADLSGVSTLWGAFANSKTLKSVNFSKADLRNVESMYAAFSSCTVLDTIDFTGADISGTKSCEAMFINSSALTCALFFNSNMSGVTSTKTMFANCSKLATIDFSGTDLSNDTTMEGMFNNCDSLKEFKASEVFSGCDLSKVTTLFNMFAECEALELVDFSGLNLSSVESISQFITNSSVTTVNFSGAILTGLTAPTGTNFFQNNKVIKNVDFSNVDFSNVTTLWASFSGCSALKTVNFAGAKLGSVTTLQSMFASGASLERFAFSEIFADCELTHLTSLQQMFDGNSGLAEVDFSGFDLSNITDMSTMFRDCSGLTTVTFSENQDLSNVTTMQDMFNGCKSLQSIDLTGAKLGKLSTVSNMFYGANLVTANFAHADLSSITDLSDMFQFCSTIKNVIFSYANLSGMKTMESRSFASKTSLVSANFSHAILTNLTSMLNMFKGCTELLSVDFSSAELSSVTSLVDLSFNPRKSIFEGCSKLTDVDFSGVEFSSSLTSISIFGGSTPITPKIKRVDFSNTKLPGVTSLRDLFMNCTELEWVDLSGFDFSNVTTMNNMFQYCAELVVVDLGAFNVNPSKNCSAQFMFNGCSNLTKIYVNREIAVSDLGSSTSAMFQNCTKLPKRDNSSKAYAHTGEGGNFTVGSLKAWLEEQAKD